MSDTTTLALRCTFVTLTGGTSTLLRKWLLAWTSDITKVFGLFENVPVFVLKVVEYIFYNIASQRQIVNVLVQLNDIACVCARFEVINWNLHRLIWREWSLRPWLFNQTTFIGLLKWNCADIGTWFDNYRSELPESKLASESLNLLKHHFING